MTDALPNMARALPNMASALPNQAAHRRMCSSASESLPPDKPSSTRSPGRSMPCCSTARSTCNMGNRGADGEGGRQRAGRREGSERQGGR
eukprot:5644524-Prymnesium_polylepis.1